jgi:type-F conjugative transfer system pilin assembly protein TrbC
MAQKKLLFMVAVVIFILFLVNTNAEAKAELLVEYVAEKDKNYFKDIAHESQAIVMSTIAEKYRELLMLRQQQDGLAEHNSLTDLDEQGRNYRDSSTLKVFVSSSMSTELLKTYVKEAKRYGAVLVFNGLPGNSWVKLNKTVMEMVEDQEGVGIQIDPEEFDRFNIKTVPAFVLIKEADWITGTSEEMVEDRVIYDKVTGNIGTEAALRLFAEQGELGAMARAKAENAGND